MRIAGRHLRIASVTGLNLDLNLCAKKENNGFYLYSDTRFGINVAIAN